MKYEIEKWFKFINYQCTKSELQSTLNFFSSERTEIREQFADLDWNADIHKQENAIEYLAENLLPCEYIYLVLADNFSLEKYNDKAKYYEHNTGKELWENAAKTIVKIGWPKVDNIIIPLFMWILDNNWPGSELIYEFLLTLPKDILKSKIEEILENPQLYEPYDFDELKELTKEML